MTKTTREPQYRGYVESAETEGLERFGHDEQPGLAA